MWADRSFILFFPWWGCSFQKKKQLDLQRDDGLAVLKLPSQILRCREIKRLFPQHKLKIITMVHTKITLLLNDGKPSWSHQEGVTQNDAQANFGSVTSRDIFTALNYTCRWAEGCCTHWHIHSPRLQWTPISPNHTRILWLREEICGSNHDLSVSVFI